MCFFLYHKISSHVVNSVSPPRRLRAGRPCRAAGIPPSFLKPLLGTQRQIPVELIAGILAVNKVTKAAAHATLATVETAARLAEVGNGAEFAVDGPGGVPAAIQVIAGFLR